MSVVRRSYHFILFGIVLCGCSLLPTEQTGRYKQHIDSAPVNSQQYSDKDFAKNATPRYEPYRTLNSKPYTVLGKSYLPLFTGKGYEAIGEASWYGQKFHGHLTSNGEVYDMFAMTAAHKTLPLPSYVKVTNLANNKTVIVRVNDRGPFHGNRIIDLSFAAAKKIGTYDNGVSKVKIEVIHVSEDNLYTVGKGPTLTFSQYMGIDDVDTPNEGSSSNNKQWFIQVFASSDKAKIKRLARVIASLYQVQANPSSHSGVHKLHLGPFEKKDHAERLLEEVKDNGYPNAYIISE
jgi:rare lipoprotein A